MIMEHLLQGLKRAYGNVQTSATPDSQVKIIIDVLSIHFANGFRLDSPIELTRFRNFFTEYTDEQISLSDEELKKSIAACGTVFDGKIYVVSAQTKERIKVLVEEYFDTGAKIIFYSEFYTKNESWLFAESVISEDMLIDILRRLFPKLLFTRTYFGKMDNIVSVPVAVEREILRVWGEDLLLNYEQLSERLQCIPIERIKSALAQNGRFVWSSKDTFSHIGMVDITQEENKTICEMVRIECNKNGYVSIADLPFGDICERNHELSINAIHNAVFRICLSEKHDKHDQIITRKGDSMDALTLIKNYCRNIEKCSLEELLKYAKELTGKVDRLRSMEAANAVLVRIDKETYVADRYVDFDTDAVDNAIARFVTKDYLPLRSFTTFGVFPSCGQEWNLFVLESYCRRFSKKFRFESLAFNSRNAGAVISKNCDLSYIEIMTDAVADANISLEASVVVSFLYESGYIGKNTNSKVAEIIDKAKAIRKMRD